MLYLVIHLLGVFRGVFINIHVPRTPGAILHWLYTMRHSLCHATCSTMAIGNSLYSILVVAYVSYLPNVFSLISYDPPIYYAQCHGLLY